LSEVSGIILPSSAIVLFSVRNLPNAPTPLADYPEDSHDRHDLLVVEHKILFFSAFTPFQPPERKIQPRPGSPMRSSPGGAILLGIHVCFVA
jgi:hypothetical protein